MAGPAHARCRACVRMRAGAGESGGRKQLRGLQTALPRLTALQHSRYCWRLTRIIEDARHKGMACNTICVSVDAPSLLVHCASAKARLPSPASIISSPPQTTPEACTSLHYSSRVTVHRAETATAFQISAAALTRPGVGPCTHYVGGCVAEPLPVARTPGCFGSVAPGRWLGRAYYGTETPSSTSRRRPSTALRPGLNPHRHPLHHDVTRRAR